MMQLYGLPISTNCAKVQVVLAHKGIEYLALPPPGGYGSPEYKALVPMGTIPGLVHEEIDGQVVLSESEAICEYLEERFPEPAMLYGSAGQRAHIRTLSRAHDCWVEPQLRALFAQMKPDGRDEDFIASRVADLHKRLGAVSRLARPAPYLAGETLSLADCAWPTTFAQAEAMLPVLGYAFELPGPLREWRATLDAQPAVAAQLAPCRAAMADWARGRGLQTA